MAPKAMMQRSTTPTSDPDGMFAGMVVFLVNNGVQARRLQIWKQKLLQNRAVIEERLTKGITHILAINSSALLQKLDNDRLSGFQGKFLLYQWLEDSLKSGEKLSEDMYILNVDPHDETRSNENLLPKPVSRRISGEDERLRHKRIKPYLEDGTTANLRNAKDGKENPGYSSPSPGSSSDHSAYTLSLANTAPRSPSNENESSSLPYNPPDLNKNITEIFGKLINIYRALGDDRRSFSYYKAITVIEKLPFKIESADQVQHSPSIGKSMKDHIQEIVTTGKLSKLEHFETDEKVRTVSLFGEVWGVGPATALKLYEKGYRTLEDLKDDDSLTNAQKLGLKYFDDIRKRIPRHEVEEMERILQKVGEEILLGVVIICGGSYRRGKATCGDMDIVITHPDGRSHKGFLLKFMKRLKEINFLKEDLVFSIHSEKGTDSGVDTYFGFCTYPGRELRHRIDFKVYPRDIYAFGLIAWTGNDVLNRRLRLLAESKGFHLDDTGLFPATLGSSGKKGTRATASLKLNAEKDVFDFLGIPWLQPHERNL